MDKQNRPVRRRDHNTMGVLEYVLTNIFYAIIAMPLYTLIRRGVKGFTNTGSSVIMLSIVAVCVIAGILLTIERRRNFFSIFANLTIPFGIYTIISYGLSLGIVLAAVLIAIAMLSGIYAYLTIRPIPADHPRRSVIRRIQLMRSFFGARAVSAVCLGVMLTVMIVNVSFGHSFLDFSEKVQKDEEYTIMANIEQLVNLEGGRWEKLSLKEKMAVMETVKNIEVDYLGLPHGITLEFGDTEEMIAAYYSDVHRKIVMSKEYFESCDGKEALRVLCHEVYHAYQYRLCDAYDAIDDEYKELLAFGNVEDYKHEIYNYIDVADDAVKYDEQLLERNADKYANDAVGDYSRKIDVYLYGEE